MTHTMRRTVAALAAFGFLVTGAVARMGPTAGSPETTHYRGTDAAGAVTFKVHDLYAGNGPVYLYDLRFAVGCGTSMSITAHIKVDRKHHFSYNAHGTQVSGAIEKKLVHSGGAVFVHFPKVTGTIVAKTCDGDRDSLAFRASEEKTGSKP
jgi:hypothetical protein